jgi:hypothetical protein
MFSFFSESGFEFSAYAKAIKQMLNTMPPIDPADPSTPVEEQALFSKLVSHSNQLHDQFSQYRKLYRTNATERRAPTSLKGD